MLDSQPLRPICKSCGILPARSNGRSVRGYQKWHTLCNSCANKKYKQIPDKDTKCNRCGFECEDKCQMCLVDGETICLNCNAIRLKGLRPHSELTVDATVDWHQIRI